MDIKICNLHIPFEINKPKLLESKNNRLIWGGMTALSTITDLKHKEVFETLDKIMRVTDTGSVITTDNGVKNLIKLTRKLNFLP